MSKRSTQPLFSIIIVTWNALEHLRTYLPSVVATDHPSFEIIIADNASTDGSADWIRQEYPNVQIASLDQNYGYCGGNNRAAQQAHGKWLIFLNNDVRVEPDWLTPLESFIQGHPQAGALQPKMRSDQQPDHFEYAGAAGGYLDHYGYPFCRGRLFDTTEPDTGQYDDPSPIFWASGAALAIRKDLFQELGGFVEDFEFHMEEIDLCWRLWRNGYQVWYVPESVVYHLGGGSLPMASPRKTYYNFRNNLRMLQRNWSPEVFKSRIKPRYLLDSLAFLKAAATFQFAEAGAIYRAYRDFRKNRPTYLPGSENKDALQPPQADFSVVWQYFVKGIRTFLDLPPIKF
ncbi:MAG: glycosyltransferase family 2 protein [Bacteroidota bacterium]